MFLVRSDDGSYDLPKKSPRPPNKPMPMILQFFKFDSNALKLAILFRRDLRPLIFGSGVIANS